MNKYIFILFSTLGYQLSAQITFKDQTQFNAGLNLSSGGGLPIYGGLDFGIHNNVTLGGIVAFNSYSIYNSSSLESYKATVLFLGGNTNYHANSLLGLSNKLDIYTGLTLGYRLFIWGSKSPLDSYSEVVIAGQLGGRYFFREDFGVNLELGGGTLSGIKLGVTYKM